MNSIPELDGWDYAPSIHAYTLSGGFPAGLYVSSDGRLINVEDISIGDETTAYATFVEA